MIIIEHSVWLDAPHPIDSIRLAHQHFKQSGTGHLVAKAILESFGQQSAHIADILNDRDQYLKEISPKLYTIVATHLLCELCFSHTP